MAEKTQTPGAAPTASQTEVVEDGVTYEKMQTNFKNLGKEFPMIKGILIQKSTMKFPGQDEPVGRYKIQDETDLVTTILGSTQLDDMMVRVVEGSKVIIRWLGTQRSGSRRDVKQFEVLVAK